MDSVSRTALRSVEDTDGELYRRNSYRPDIDGLRAIAVVAVILYHAHVPGFGGGYVGVDVFFVISGYLITQLLTGPAGGGLRMGLRQFYFRRARRILPALLLVALTAAVASAVILLPWELARFGKYLAAAAVAATNITALGDANYFDAGAHDVALLHYWSLAVEEQFYLLYPAALLIIGRCVPLGRLPVLLALAGLSFAVCVWGSQHHPIANFYLAPSRAWELLLGAVVAGKGPVRIESPRIKGLLGTGSLLVIALAVYTYGPYTPYPGIAALAPCAAAATLIVVGREGSCWTTPLLALPPLVFTGRISYSLYLWHWPVLVLFTYYNIREPDPAQLGVLIVSTYLLSVASWMWVEEPIRGRSALHSSRVFLAAAAAVTAFTVVLGIALWKSEGLPWRFSPDIVALAAGTGAPKESGGSCEPVSAAGAPVGQLCRYGPPEAGPVALIWGDSHSKALLDVYRRLTAAHHMTLYLAGEAGCRPLLGVEIRALAEPLRLNCALFNDELARKIARMRPHLVVLNAHWIDSDTDLIDQPSFATAPGQSRFELALGRTVRTVHSATGSICVVLDVPTLKYPGPYALAMARRRGIDAASLRMSRAEAAGQYRDIEQHIRALERLGMLKVADPKDVLCGTGFCALQHEGQPLYRDSDHLSVTGADFVSSAIEPCFEGIP